MLKSVQGWIALVLILALVVVPVAGAGLAVQFHPQVASPRPPDAVTAALARDLATTLRDAAEAASPSGSVTLTLDQINATLLSVARLQEGVSGEARIQGETLEIDASAGAPILPGGAWGNLHLGIGASERGLRMTSARLGHLPIPAAVVEWGLRGALDRMLGDGLGGVLLDGIGRVGIADGAVTVGYAYDPADWARLNTRLKERVRTLAGGADAQRIFEYFALLDKAGDAGDLPRSGSVLPYLRHVITESAPRSESENRRELQAGLLSLMLYCGEKGFGRTVGAILPENFEGPNNHCDGTRLGGRDDLKRHFIVSAGIYAAKTEKAAFGMGELKELLDSNSGGTGFSFDDMAADMAGTRFAQVFLSRPSHDWPAMLALMESEADVLPSIEGLPTGLSDAEFRARYGDVDSAAYKAQIDEISRRLNEMPLYAGVAAN